jgi:hypothetical protein
MKNLADMYQHVSTRYYSTHKLTNNFRIRVTNTITGNSCDHHSECH